jgi:ribonuclease-3
VPGAAAAAAAAANNTPDPKVISAALGVELSDELVVLALTHRSFAYEHGGLPTNERLEFLGDSVLGVIITDVLYRTHPTLPEGKLAKLRASVVNMHALAGVGRRMGLGEQLRLGRGEEMTGGRDKSSIVADAVEAVIGAVYLQHGLDTTRLVIHRLFSDLLTAAPQLGAGLDWKTSLQELSAERGLGVPEYRVTEEGPDHAKIFAARVLLTGLARGEGSGRTKKEAEQNAAAAAYTSLQGGPANGDAAGAPEIVTPTGAPMTDSAAVDSAPVDKAAVDSAAADGAAADGAAADGAAADGAAAGGVAASAVNSAAGATDGLARPARNPSASENAGAAAGLATGEADQPGSGA